MKSWGCDPELMLKDGNAYISAINVVQGSPEHRLNIQGHEFLKRNRWNYKYLIYRLITKFSNRS